MNKQRNIIEQFNSAGINLSRASFGLWLQNTLGRRTEVPLRDRVFKGNVMKCLGPYSGPTLQVRLYSLVATINTNNGDCNDTFVKALYQLVVSINPTSELAIDLVKRQPSYLLQTSIAYSDAFENCKHSADNNFKSEVIDLVEQVITGSFETLHPILSFGLEGSSEIYDAFNSTFIQLDSTCSYKICEGKFLQRLAILLNNKHTSEQLLDLFTKIEELFCKYNYLPVFSEAADMLAYDLYETEKSDMLQGELRW